MKNFSTAFLCQFWVIAFTAAFLLSACSNSDSSPKKSSTENHPEKIAERIDDYLYQIHYDDYNFDSLANIINKDFAPPKAACSQVRKGNFVARNFDWYINQDATAIMRVKGNAKRFASISLSGAFPLFKQVDNKIDFADGAIDLLPFYAVDGINEKGLYVGINVAPTGETSMDKNKWAPHTWGLGAALKNSQSQKHYSVTYLVRFVLDNASSVDDAIEKIQAIDWFEPYNFPAEGETQSFHWLLADNEKNMVFEFIDNKPRFLQTNKIEEPSLATIMTNFSNAVMADSNQQRRDSLIQNFALGLERYDILYENYKDTEISFEGMKGLINKIRFSHIYTDSISSKNFPFTDYVGAIKEDGKGVYLAEDLYKNEKILDDKFFLKKVDRIQNNFKDKSNWHTTDTQLWYTTHSVVYNLNDMSFEILLHEGFDGMKKWQKFKL